MNEKMVKAFKNSIIPGYLQQLCSNHISLQLPRWQLLLHHLIFQMQFAVNQIHKLI